MRSVAAHVVLVSVMSMLLCDRAGAQGASAPLSAPAKARWSGTYIGLQFGAQLASSRITINSDDSSSVATVLKRIGPTGGVQFGDGRSAHGIYIGGVVDAAFGRFVSGRVSVTQNGAPISVYVAHRRFVGTLRGKVGFPLARLLFYGTAGTALGGLEQGLAVDDAASAMNSQSQVSKGGVTVGYVLSGGAEYRLSRHLSCFGEPTYYGFRDAQLSITEVPNAGLAGNSYSATLRNSGYLFKLGVNYHFGNVR